MIDNKVKIRDLLSFIILESNLDFPESSTNLVPATKNQIDTFIQRANSKGVDPNVTRQLVELYEVADHFYDANVISFHSCEDATIFEWWDDQELWLGSRHFYILRWANGKFCLGDVGSISFSEDNEHDTLVELIEGCISEINMLKRYDENNEGDTSKWI